MELLYTLLLAVFLAVASHYIGQALPRESFFADRFPTAPLPLRKTAASTAASACTNGWTWCRT